MQPLPWNDLQHFLAVARAGQLARAAIAMKVDATTIARRVRRLELRLGHSLFEQTREGQVLTETGERLLALVETMASAADRIGEQPRHARGLSGLLRVSVAEGFGSWFISRHLHEFVDAHPDLTIDLAATSGFLSPSKRETDLAVLLARPRAGPVTSSKLSDYSLRLYATEPYLARFGTPVDKSELAQRHRLIGYVPDLLYSPELRYLSELDDRSIVRIRSSSINAQHRLIAAGTGVGFLPRFIGDQDGLLVPVLPDLVIRRSFWIVTHRDTRLLERIRTFRAWLIDTVARHRTELLG